jgi:formyltetrahydrofolate deformylase
LLPSPHDKRKCEQEIKDWIGQDIDPIVPARYMQILRPEFVGHYVLRTINVHHCFLPVFVGCKAVPPSDNFRHAVPDSG